MDWKVLVLMAITPYVLSLPLEFCCRDNSIPSSSFDFQIHSTIPELNANLEAYMHPALSSPEIRNQVMVYEEPSPCCISPILPKTRNKISQTKDRTSIEPHRVKRFPIHLDPLYQYRYLARSGQCPTAKDGQPEFYCPTPDKMGNWRCIDDFQLCDGVRHCPNGEDELPVSCLFYRVVETHLHSVSQRLNSDESRQKIPR